jgi:uncharacterized membrane protein YbhN (UPF0104 family)
LRLVGGAAVLGALAWRMGAGPFREALASLQPAWLLLAVVITAATTACSAWRWCLVARALGEPVAPGTACAAYYRSQVLNATLPGGVVGDVHRGFRHGRDVGDLGLGLRAVAWERGLGQGVLVLLALAGLVVLPVSPGRAWTFAIPGGSSVPVLGPIAIAAAVVVAVAIAVVGGLLRVHVRRRRAVGSRRGRVAAAGRALARDLRRIATRRALPGVAVTSLLATLGYAALFLASARAAGVQAPLGQLLPLALLVLLAAALPVNVAGWGPREGAATWAFAAAGLGAEQGLTSSVVFGVLLLVGTLPGLLTLAPLPHRTREEVRRG